MSEEKSKEKRLEEKEKLEAEIARSLSVVKVKEIHKQIEDVEKLRKRGAVLSIIERLSLNIGLSKTIIAALTQVKKEFPNQKFNMKLTEDDSTKKYLNKIMEAYTSIRFDLQRNIDIKEEELNRIFPIVEPVFSTYDSIVPNLNCLNMQMSDIKAYCIRLF